MLNWLKNNAAILILSLSIALHAFAVIHNQNAVAYDAVQKVLIMNADYQRIPVKVLNK